ncbi:Ig-like domain-containing protein [Nocardioides sp.]|uniref:L,D-transpeptidase n=1 Tax=Nocardioides sp. TaxID=35761 RepID=UPI002604CAE2|nr:Ig-like domain-containing protein [Nocardioides sp.]MDI6908965.1 Ig-like domain-containing protein [Nocardioides sp.]
MSQSRPRSGAAAALALTAALTLSACQSNDLPGASALAGDDPTATASEKAPALRLVSSVEKGATDVPVDRELSVEAKGGSIDSVAVSSPAGKIPGQVQADGARWVATGRLEPGTAYTMKTVARKADGTQVSRTARFRTQDLTLDEQTYPSVAPLAGETVGVGMPVIVTFDLPVTDKAAFEKHMDVTSSPSQPGAWHWISDTEAHWRPKSYWKAGADVHVDIDVNSVPAGHGIYGQESRELDFHVGDAHVYRVNAQTHQLQVFSNGKLLRTLPTTTGKPGFTTRSGVKVIIEKFPVKRMNSETVGIPADSSEAYDIDDVQWAMRVTYSGEFIHAAPWSVASQGHANVSHGCTGLSTADAGWLYAMSRRGDVVEYTGTDKPMTLTNGYGDWNESFQQYRQGSALS